MTIHTRKRLCLGLIVLNLLLIWGNSLLPGSISGAMSEWLREFLGLPSHVGGADPEGILRKLAHLLEFTSLGVLLAWHSTMQRVKIPALCGFLAACTDEIIQYFVPDRGPGLSDVLIDTIGAVIGIILFRLAARIYQKYLILEDNSQ